MALMMTGQRRSRTTVPAHSDTERGPARKRSNGVDFELVLEVLSDEYACELVRTLEGGQMYARDLIEQCEMSRPTVYRRLETLSEAGLIGSRQSSTADGRQRTEYHLVVDAVEFQLHPDGVTGAVRSDATDR